MGVFVLVLSHNCSSAYIPFLLGGFSLLEIDFVQKGRLNNQLSIPGDSTMTHYSLRFCQSVCLFVDIKITRSRSGDLGGIVGRKYHYVYGIGNVGKRTFFCLVGA